MKTDYNLGNEHIKIKSNSYVRLNEELYVFSEDGPITLDVEISADFNTIPEKYHEIFLNVLTSKYLGKVSFGENPFSECKPIVRRKWWQFWKSEYFAK